METRRAIRLASPVTAALLAVAVTACAESTSPTFNTLAAVEEACSIPSDQILPGGPGRDGIPALTNPPLVSAEHTDARYVQDTARVIGIRIDSTYLAVPFAIMWWHEIVNLDVGGLQLAVTHCPLTGSSLVFDRSVIGGAEFGVSGLLYLNNLIVYDRTSEESLWPQMSRGARCGSRVGTDLRMYPAVEMRWREWRALHPGTRVVSWRTGYTRDYATNPYAGYAWLHNDALLFPLPHGIDDRRPPKERVLGVLADGHELAYPFGELDGAGALAAVHDRIDTRPVVVFWSRAARSAIAFDLESYGTALTFSIVGDRIVDEETGSEWTIDGRAVAGPLTGEQLPVVADAFVAYWFAWSAFHRGASFWTRGAS